jgi:Ferric reductase like transmembrane component
MISFLDQCLLAVKNLGLRLRWRLTGRLFHWFVLPKTGATTDSKLSGYQSLAFLTVGHILIMLPLLALIVAGLRSAFLAPSPHRSGVAAWYSIVAAFVLANKSSSALSILLGQSWERLVPFHHMAAYIALWNSILHGYVAYTYDAANATRYDQEDNVVTSDSNTTSSYLQDYQRPIVQYDVLSQYSRNGEDPDILAYLFDGSVNFSGTIMAIFLMVLILTSSIRWFR